MLDQCFVHTDIGPHNTMLKSDGKVMFIDLDDTGIGSRYLDLGWPFIMQSYGPDAVEALWQILLFGMEQKELLWEMLQEKNG